MQPRANSARLRGVTITDGENRECRLTRGFFSTIELVMFPSGPFDFFYAPHNQVASTK